MAKLGPDDRPGYQDVEIIAGYNRWASTYDRQVNPLILLEENVTLELIGQVQGQQVLDLGCGTGRYCTLLAKRGASVVGVDPSMEMLAQAKIKAVPFPHIELHQSTLEEMNFPDERFDLVVSALALSHLAELESTLREASRILKRGGRMIVSDIHPYWPLSGHDYVEFFDETGQEYRIPEYPHLIEEYWLLFNKFGMRLEDIREPRIEDWLIEQIPSLQDYRGVPLAMVLKAWRLPF